MITTTIIMIIKIITIITIAIITIVIVLSAVAVVPMIIMIIPPLKRLTDPNPTLSIVGTFQPHLAALNDWLGRLLRTLVRRPLCLPLPRFPSIKDPNNVMFLNYYDLKM
jgi:hypothetical protein